MRLPSTPFFAGLTLLTGCALVYNYGDYREQDAGGTGGAGTSSVTTTGTSTTTGTTSSTTTGSTTTSSSTASSSSSTTSSSSSTTSSSSTGGGCAGGETCAPEAPLGWSGPVAFETGATMPGCPDANWPNVDPMLAGGTTFSASGMCTACGCLGAPTGGVCPSSVPTTVYPASNCTGQGSALQLGMGCTPFAHDAIAAPAVSVTGASCAAVPATPVGKPAFTGYGQGCTAGGAGAACSGGTCVKLPTHLCIYAAGPQTCPNAYPLITTPVSSGLTDDRTCTACTCTASGGTCGVTVEVFSDADAGTCFDSTELTTTTAGTCTTWNGAAAWVSVSVGDPSGGACSDPSGGAPGGSVVQNGEITVCCAQ